MSELRVQSFVTEHLCRLRELLDQVPAGRVETIGETLVHAYRHGKQVFVAGNGGSAATALHMATDLAKSTIGPNRTPLRIESLNENAPLLTALANDEGYDNVFSQQLLNRIGAGDILIVFSASGRSANVLQAARYARSRSATVIAFLGADGGDAVRLTDECVVVASEDYGVVEDMHLILHHALTGYFKRRLAGEELGSS